jgi:hypothetical protein
LCGTDLIVDRGVGGEVHMAKRDHVSLEHLEVSPGASDSAFKYTHLRPPEGQAVSELLCLLN